MSPHWKGLLGTDSGRSAPTITRLTTQWQDDAKQFAKRDLSGVDYMYVWADGVHLNIRLDEEKLCLLVLVGVRVDGSKELIALAEGYRESAGSWADLLRDAKRRGMHAPVLAVGDGALGFWSALREVFPGTREHCRETDWSWRTWPCVNARRNSPSVDGAYTPPNNCGIPPWRTTPRSSIESAR